MRHKVDIHLGVDLDVDAITAPAPLDAGDGYARQAGQPERTDGAWFVRTSDGHRKFVPRNLKEPASWNLLP